MPFRPGFDPKWTDETDYINGITHEIWEERRIHTLHDYYGPSLVVRSPASVVIGNQGIIAATQSTLAEFPDRKLLGEDVMWCDAGSDAFLSSHRLLCTATHSGSGAYGAPTGKQLRYRIIADCFCRANQVEDEWLIRDQAAIVRQMGFEVRDWTASQIEQEGGPEHCVRPWTPDNNPIGPYEGTGNDNPWGAKAADILTRIASAELSVIPQTYDRACRLSYPGSLEASGTNIADRFWLGIHSTVPSANFTIYHALGREDKALPPRAAIRWSLLGKHDGNGMFGVATGADLYIAGMTHFEFGPNGVRREWTLIDETAVWKQILIAAG
jgi:predicted ester cyclase